MGENGLLNGRSAQLVEYWALKAEQARRIDYRDHMVHVHLALVGAAIAWGIEHHSHYILFAVPWICLIIGWTYLINDDRIGAIGAYIRLELADQFAAPRAVGPQAGPPSACTPSVVFGWEVYHRSDPRRLERKRWQFGIDLIEFVLTGFAALGLVVWLEPALSYMGWVVFGAESLLLIGLGIQFYRYTDFRTGK